MLRVREISKGLYESVLGVCSKTYLQDRPSAREEQTDDFLVVSLPSFFENRELDGRGGYDYWESTAVFTIFVKDRASAGSLKMVAVNLLSERVERLLSLFPIKIAGLFRASRPSIIVSSNEDGNGYHYCRIQSELTTLVNASSHRSVISTGRYDAEGEWLGIDRYTYIP